MDPLLISVEKDYFFIQTHSKGRTPTAFMLFGNFFGLFIRHFHVMCEESRGWAGYNKNYNNSIRAWLVVLNKTIPEVVPDVQLDVVPDVVPDVQPDVVPDVQPDEVPDVQPDVVLDVQPDVMLEVLEVLTR